MEGGRVWGGIITCSASAWTACHELTLSQLIWSARSGASSALGERMSVSMCSGERSPCRERILMASCDEKMTRCASKRPRVTYEKHEKVTQSSSDCARASRPSAAGALLSALTNM